MKKTLVLLSALVIVLAKVSSVFALTISPARLELRGDPGQTLTGEITLINDQKDLKTFYASFENFEADGDSGTPKFVGAKEGLATWFSASEAVVLKAGESKKIPFTITIPKDTTPGGYFGAIFWNTVPPGGISSGEIAFGAKTGMLVLLSVNGEVKEEAGLVDFQLHNNKHFYKQLPVGFQYRFSNQGGDRVKPEGFVMVRSILGWTVKKVNANPTDGNVLPGTTRKFLPEWSKDTTVDQRDQEIARNETYSFFNEVQSQWHNFAVGIYRAKVVATFGSAAQSVKSKAVYFVVFPWELLLVIIIIGVPLFFILRALVRRYNRSVIKRAQKQLENGRMI